MSADPAFASTPGSEATAIPATANTARDGTGTVTTVVTAGSGGSRVERLKVKAVGTTTAGMIRVFRHNGTIFTLLDELPVSAITPSATVETWEGELLFGAADPEYPEILPSGWTIRVSTHNAEAFSCHVVAGDF